MNRTPFLDNERLRDVRQNTDWRKLFTALQIRKDQRKSREHDWWGWSPLNPDEGNASFHMNDRGWYCHSTGRGGGPIELLQALHQGMTCYDAGRWLLDHRVSFLVAETRSAITTTEGAAPTTVPTKMPSVQSRPTENRPIRQDLRSRLDPTHPTFTERGIPVEVLQDLGVGFWQRQQARKDGKPDPLNGRLVFQVRRLHEDDEGLKPVILTHTGRALTAEQEERDGKWWTFPGFVKSLELYNVDLAILDDEAIRQANETEHVIIVEGCFDVAKLWAAGIKNVVATFGARLYAEQLPRLELLSELLGVDRFLIWYDRDQDGSVPHGRGAIEALNLIRQNGYAADVFDWNQSFSSPRRGTVPIPSSIQDPCEFSMEQLRWLREWGWV